MIVSQHTVRDDLIGRRYLVEDMYAHRRIFENEKDFERALDVIANTRAIISELSIWHGPSCGDEYENCPLSPYGNKALGEISGRIWRKVWEGLDDEQPV